MNLTIPFLAASAIATTCQYLDWDRTKSLIPKSGLAGEIDPIARFFFSKSVWAALAYKMAPISYCVWLARFHFRDVQNYGVQYTNASGTDHWGIAWILTQLAVAGIGLYGYLKSK